MSARFNDLHDVAQVLVEQIRERVGLTDVQAGSPRDVTATIAAGARVTLLYTTPSVTHRNDPIETQANGSRRHPPLALTCNYLVTCSGADGDDPIAAHHALGEIMTLFHDEPRLQLPVQETGFSPLGEGVFDIVQVPIQTDLVDKIWSSIDGSLQPWCLFEVGPVQLVSAQPDLPASSVVAPGGIGLQVRAGSRPLITRLTPATTHPLGRIRIDAISPAEMESLRVDNVTVAANDPSLDAEPDGSRSLLRLDAIASPALRPGTHSVQLNAQGFSSPTSTFQITDSSAPALSAPATFVHDGTAPLTLNGANLAAAEGCVVWPDQGVPASGQVFNLALSAATADSVTIAPAELSTLTADDRTWRLALQFPGSRFSDYVLLGFTW